jgi:hypothetical protein
MYDRARAEKSMPLSTDAPRPGRRSRPGPAMTAQARRLLLLQRTAGNAAVTGMVQRLHPAPHPGGGSPLGVGVETPRATPGADVVAPHPAQAPAHVQRRVGYEFETTNKSWKVHEQVGHDWRVKTDSKKNLIPIGNAPATAHVNADNGNVEFVTEPLSTYQEVKATVERIVSRYAELKSQKETVYTVGGATYKVTTGKQDSTARPQATFGVQMHNIRSLVDELARMYLLDHPPTTRTAEGPPAKRLRARDQPGVSSEQRSEAALRGRITAVTGQGGGALRAAYGDAAAILRKLPTWPNLTTVAEQEAAAGFLTVILKTIADSAGAKNSEDPKYMYPMMARTDFASMLLTLPDQPRGLLVQSWQNGPLDTELDSALKLAGGRKNGVDSMLLGTRTDNVTIRAWIDSIITPSAKGKDLLSPPPGFREHGAPGVDNEGMGSLEADSVDPEKSVFELRDLGSELLITDYLPLALMVADLVGRATNDDQLKKPTT